MRKAKGASARSCHCDGRREGVTGRLPGVSRLSMRIVGLINLAFFPPRWQR